MKKIIPSVTLIAAIIVFYPIHVLKGGDSPAQEKNYPGNRLVIWAHSDIQPRNLKERAHYEIAAADVRDNLQPVDMGIMAGDIVQYSDSDNDFMWILETRKMAAVPYWYEITGNHDARNIANFFKYMKKPLYYSVIWGNVIIIFLADEINSSPTEISDHSFRFWEECVTKNQDKTVITITHAQIPESGLVFSSIHRSKILDSGRFVNVLKKYRVDLWLSGHTTLPPFGEYQRSRPGDMNNTLFVNISGIRRDLGNVRSCFLFFEKGKGELIVRFRDHDRKKFIEGKEEKIVLRAPFNPGEARPVMVMPEGVIIPE